MTLLSLIIPSEDLQSESRDLLIVRLTYSMPRNTAKNVREITVAHSPDSDDAFMFYGMATNKIRVPGVKFTHTLCDIETLNRKAMDGFYDITAISFHAYPYIQDKYALMPSGGSVGEGYGPMIVASRNIPLDEISSCKIAVPGTMTTAYLALKLFAPEIVTEVVPFDEIIPRVLAGQVRGRAHHSRGPAHLQQARDCTAFWTWASGGAIRPVCRCRWAATPFAASWARS